MLPSALSPFVFLQLAAFVRAGTVTYNWDVTWVTASPDGFSRPVIGINGAWPCPKIEATVGDIIVVNLNNKLGNETTGLHFHGINQVNTDDMDGPSGVTQCPVPPGSSITYTFLADSPGTFWYHSHNMGQYPDGLRGPLIVQDPFDPYKDQYTDEEILIISDWYHDQTITLVQNMLSPSNTQFIPPIPDSVIINEGGNGTYPFVEGKTYRFRIICVSAFASAMLHFNSHTMQVIMNDASYIQEAQAYQLRIAPGQRYDVLISAIDRDHGNYPFLVSLDINRDYTNTDAGLVWPYNITGYLEMDPGGALPQDVVDAWRPVDDSHFLPLDDQGQLGPVGQTMTENFNFCFDKNGIPRACFNNQTYIQQKVPTLYSAATTGNYNTNPIVYGDVNPVIVPYGTVVQIVINNLDAAVHPFHLHGHQFQVLDRPGSNTGVWSGHSNTFPATPPRRDTVAVMANSYAVLRFEATNPGVFLFHCHIEWHVEMGLTATVIEAPEFLRGMIFPPDHIAACKAMGMPTEGNAGGDVTDPLNTSNYNTVPPQTYTGALYEPTATPRLKSRVVRGKVL